MSGFIGAPVVLLSLATSLHVVALEVHSVGRSLRRTGHFGSADLRNTAGSLEDGGTCDCKIGALTEAQRNASQAVFEDFLKETRHWVLSAPAHSARAHETDRVAVTVFQPQSRLDVYSYVVRWNMRMLGPKWALQIFYGTENDRAALEQALGSPPFVIWTPIRLHGKRRQSITLEEYNRLRLSTDFWETIGHEHVLIFETDSLVLRRDGCVDFFLPYDYVGAPWPDWIGGNGGFTLRRRSSALRAVKSPHCAKYLEEHPEYIPEDKVMLMLLSRMNVSIAPREEAMRFSVESINYQAPCGFHKPWGDCGKCVMRRFMAQARKSMK